MKSVSLFSGIGGFDLGFQRSGIECVAVCEIDKNAQSILRRHFPNAQLFDDVRKVGRGTHERKSIDLVCGGFPCQDVSIAGKRAGLAGERSGLWFEFARVIDELEPQWVVIENVPGLLSSNGGRDFAIIIRWLAKRGYGVAWRVLDAQYFGVPQRRRRVFIVGSFGDGRAAEVLFEQDSSCGDNPQSREAGKDVAYSLRANPSHSGDKGDGGLNTTLIPSRSVAETLTGQNHKGLGGGVTNRSIPNLVMAHGQANAEIVSDGSPSLTTNHEQPILFVSDFAQITSKEHGSKPSEISQPLNTLGQMTVWHNHQQDGSIRMQEDGTAPTVSHQWGTGWNNVPFVGVRRLMPIECERLQGFPDGWTDGQSDSTRYRQLGNAVAVPVIEWIGKRIMAVTRKPLFTPKADSDLGKVPTPIKRG